MTENTTHVAQGPKEIVTLPPLPVLNNELPTSPRTGEPHRPPVVLVAFILLVLAAASVAVTYGLHWWAAANPENYADSARLIGWVDPEPGKWLSLTLEGALAIFAALAAAACGVAGLQAWRSQQWSRWAGLVAVVLTGGMTALFDWTGLVSAGLAVVGAALLFTPPATRFFREFIAFRAVGHAPYRRPERIFYGRLPRFR